MANEITPVNAPQQTIESLDSSFWGAINKNLLMVIQECSQEGVIVAGAQVIGVPIDGDMSLESQYSTPFENSNPEQKLPTLAAMIQDGSWVKTGSEALTNYFGKELSPETKDQLNSLQGRTNLTKVNSTQIFVSTNPVTLHTTLLFSAWEDAKTEVEDQIKQLSMWALPVKLQKESILGGMMAAKSLLAFYPSIAPTFVAVTYGGKTYKPMVLQSVSVPLVAPMNQGGSRINVQVQLNLVSRTAWDQKDIQGVFG